MLEGLLASASGMTAQQQQLDAVAGNLANASTPGYRAQQLAFSDLLYSKLDEAGTLTTEGAGSSARTLGGMESQGAIRQTGNPFDLAIQGAGFFQVKTPAGQPALTRDGSFSLDSRRQLVGSDGSVVQPPITVPSGISPQQVKIAPDGTVSAGARRLGRIAIVNVAAPDRLLAAGSGQFTSTAASGPARPAKGASLVQGALEGSNVDVGSEMVTMMSTERSYQMGASAIKIEGQMMSIANQLR